MKQWQHMGNKKQQRDPGRSNRDFISSSNRPIQAQLQPGDTELETVLGP
jgi:hypothetical protein